MYIFSFFIVISSSDEAQWCSTVIDRSMLKMNFCDMIWIMHSIPVDFSSFKISLFMFRLIELSEFN